MPNPVLANHDNERNRPYILNFLIQNSYQGGCEILKQRDPYGI